ncbi:hypothetical protein NM688_g6886 [Phlebia brevispora]|uniref:Uncharacterized protein n=1 Tax=Phlebia brevispora TaxID=194682 RepID=A0ACC1SBD9_9APHY|nr:hypothetical protein NM688_g6886 [Phlebia brevispora]
MLELFKGRGDNGAATWLAAFQFKFPRLLSYKILSFAPCGVHSTYHALLPSESSIHLTSENKAVPPDSPPDQAVEPIATSPRRKATFNVDDSTLPQRDPSRRNTRRLSTQSTLNRLSLQIKGHMQPPVPVGQPPSFWRSLKAIICASYFNLLLVFIPVSWALHFVWANNTTAQQDTLVFVFSFLSIIPLAKLLAFATDELSMRVGQTLAGLMNATLGNAVELIVAIIALVKCELQVVQSSLVGSILSNLLLVLGMCFFAGGTRFSEQGFGVSSVQLNSSLLTVSVIAVLLPAAFHFTAGNAIPDPSEGHDILAMSHGAALILLFIYLCYIIFQLFSHKDLYADDNTEIMKSRKYPVRPPNQFTQKLRSRVNHLRHHDVEAANGSGLALTELEGSPQSASLDSHADPEASAPDSHSLAETETPEVEEPSMSVPMTIFLLAGVTVLVAVTAEFLVDSINGLTSTGKISTEFVGIILLPIVGNAAEHVTAVTVSMKDKITLSLGVAVGSSIQIALFVIPFIVTLGWWIGKPLTLLFDPFESIVLFLAGAYLTSSIRHFATYLPSLLRIAVIVVNYTVADGRSNWLEGMILMCLYVMLAVVFWYYPGASIISHRLTIPDIP